MRVSERNDKNGGCTCRAQVTSPSTPYSGTLPTGNCWSCQQNNANNAWNVVPSTGNVNNNNKNNTYSVVPVAEYLWLQDLLFVAEAECWKNKKSRANAAQFHYKQSNIFELLNEIWEGGYKPSASICFVLTYPKYREVFAAMYRDRVIHHLIAPFMRKITEAAHKANGNISHGNRNNFSAHTAAEQIQANMRIYPNGYVSTMDVSGFFMNIERLRACEIFKDYMRRYPPCGYTGEQANRLLSLTLMCLMNDATQGAIRHSPENMWLYVDKNKSLFGNNGKGLPIGNFYSQLMANLVLAVWAEAVQAMCLECRITQFVDDMCVISASVDIATKVRRASAEVLNSIGLRLHTHKYYIQPVRHGVLFCGRYVYVDRMYISNRTARAMARAVSKAIKAGGVEAARHLQCSFNSYSGMMCHTRSYNIQRKQAGRVLKSSLSQFVYFVRRHRKIVCQIKKEFKKNCICLENILFLQKILSYEYRKIKQERGNSADRCTTQTGYNKRCCF